MPRHVKPMLAVLSTLPRDEDGWAFEIKWDGVRAIAYCETGRAAPREPHPPRDHLALSGAPRAGRRARLTRSGARRRDRRLRRRGQAELRAAPEPHEPRLRGGRPPPDGRRPGDLHGLRPALRRRTLPGRRRRTPNGASGWRSSSSTGRTGRRRRVTAARERRSSQLTKARGLEGLVAKRLDSRYLVGSSKPRPGSR